MLSHIPSNFFLPAKPPLPKTRPPPSSPWPKVNHPGPTWLSYPYSSSRRNGPKQEIFGQAANLQPALAPPLNLPIETDRKPAGRAESKKAKRAAKEKPGLKTSIVRQTGKPLCHYSQLSAWPRTRSPSSLRPRRAAGRWCSWTHRMQNRRRRRPILRFCPACPWGNRF